MALILSQRVVVGTIVDVYEPRTVGRDDTTVVNFTVAITPSVKDGDGWTDGETEFLRCTAWRRVAENIAKTFNKGDRIILVGRQTMEPEREGKDGETIPARPNLTVDFAGLDLTFDGADSHREAKNVTTAKDKSGDSSSSSSKKSKGKASNPSSSKNSNKAKKNSKPKEEDVFDDDDDEDIFGSDDDDIFGDDD